MTSKHTPGPWALMDIGDYTDFEGRSQVIMSEDLSGEDPFRLAVVHVSSNDPESIANARLIAAAPELLDALIELRDAPWLNLPGRAGDIIQSAIQRATGGAEG